MKSYSARLTFICHCSLRHIEIPEKKPYATYFAGLLRLCAEEIDRQAEMHYVLQSIIITAHEESEIKL